MNLTNVSGRYKIQTWLPNHSIIQGRFPESPVAVQRISSLVEYMAKNEAVEHAQKKAGWGIIQCALHVLALGCFLLAFWKQVSQFDILERVENDSYGYVTTAYNIYSAGVFSHACEDFSTPCPPEKIQPTNYREPLYPAFLALALELYPYEIPRQSLFHVVNEMNPVIHAYLRKYTIGLIFFTALFSFGISRLLTRSWIASYLTLFLVGTSPKLSQNVRLFLSENLAALLLTASVFFCILSISRRRPAWMIPSGLFFGLLALTKGIYHYGFFVILGVALLFLLFSSTGRRNLATGIVFFSVFTWAVLGLWSLRNYRTFGSTSVASRGGIMLMIRLFHNDATDEEYRALYWYATPFRAWVNPSEEQLKRVDRLSRSNPNGFYLGGRAYASTLTNRFGATEAEKMLTKEAIGRIAMDPWKHLMISVPLALGAIYVEAPKDFFGIFVLDQFHVALFVFACVLPVFFASIVIRDSRLLVLTGPVFFSLFFHALISNSLPRYNQPLIGLLWISVALCAYGLATVIVKLARKIFGFSVSSESRLTASTIAIPRH